MFRFKRKRPAPPPPDRPRRRRGELIRNVLAMIGAGTVLYFFVTEVVMRVLAFLTPGGGRP